MALTAQQIKKGFWERNEKKQFPPETITRISEYTGQDRVNLFITQTGLPAGDQKKLVSEWCDLLPGLNRVKVLWLHTRVSQKIFDAVCRMPGLEALYIKWGAVKDISKLADIEKLKHLHLSSAGIESIEVLSAMKGLITLELEQLNKISDFSPVASLKNLEGIALDGSHTAKQKIETLEPLAGLKKLKYCTLLNSSILDKELSPLFSLKGLERFETTFRFSEQQVDKLKGMVKTVKVY